MASRFWRCARARRGSCWRPAKRLPFIMSIASGISSWRAAWRDSRCSSRPSGRRATAVRHRLTRLDRKLAAPKSAKTNPTKRVFAHESAVLSGFFSSPRAYGTHGFHMRQRIVDLRVTVEAGNATNSGVSVRYIAVLVAFADSRSAADSRRLSSRSPPVARPPSPAANADAATLADFKRD